MNETTLKACAAALAAAFRTGKPLENWPDNAWPNSLLDAYRVQDCVVEMLGLSIGGWKIGCTSQLAQLRLGASGPIAGPIPADRLFVSGKTLRDVRMDMLVLEGEIAFRLGADLPARALAWDRAEVADAVDAIYPAIELVQARTIGRAPIGGIVADLCCAGSLILGEPILESAHRILTDQSASLSVDGVEVAVGSGREVLGDPMNALVWLANFQSSRGQALSAGTVVTTGTCFTPIIVQPGQDVKMAMAGLGSVQVRFERP